MSEEEKIETKCFCQSKGFRKFLVTALGTFVGVYAALSLFAAIHKPPMPPCPMGYRMMPPIAAPCPYHQYKHFDKKFIGERKNFHKDFNGQKSPSPFNPNKNLDKD